VLEAFDLLTAIDCAADLNDLVARLQLKVPDHGLREVLCVRAGDCAQLKLDPIEDRWACELDALGSEVEVVEAADYLVPIVLELEAANDIAVEL